MKLFEPLLIALSTYSADPPFRSLTGTKKICAMRSVFFPAVGLFCGAALWLWAVIAQATGMSGVLFAAVAACLPILVTGGIHMDGYLDTVDALASHQTREKKLEIMKDPSCGAFAGHLFRRVSACLRRLCLPRCILRGRSCCSARYLCSPARCRACAR